MATIKGVYEGTSIKSGTGKNGKPYKLYSIIVDGKYFGWGFDVPKIAANTVIEFSAEQNDKGFWNADTSSVKELGEAPATKPVAAGSSTASSSYDPRQASIELQSSIASASRIVAAQIMEGANISDPANAVASLVQSFLNILHPKPAAPKKAKQPEEETDEFPA